MGELIAEYGLVALQFCDLVLIAADDRRIRRVDDARQERLDLLFNDVELAAARLDDVCRMSAALIPGDREHCPRHLEQGLRRLEGTDQLAHITFELVPLDRLAVAPARLRLAEVIWIVFAMAALAPRRAQRHLAIGADYGATHDEVVANILAQGHSRDALATLLHLVEGVERDQRLMVPLEPVDGIGLADDVAGVERLRQDVGDALLGDDAFAVAREFREALEEAFDFRIRLEAADGTALEGIADDRRQRLVGLEDLAAAAGGFVEIADRSSMYPVACLHARGHLLRHLTAILLALQFALGGNDGLDELAFGAVFLKLEVQAFDGGAALAQRIAQIEVMPGVAGKALRIVEYDHKTLLRLGVYKAEQRHHAGALHEVATAADRVGKDGHDLIAFCGSVLPTAVLLAVQSTPIVLLRLR